MITLREVPLLVVVALVWIAFGCHGDDHDHGHNDHDHRDVPDEYAGLRNPFAGDPDAVGRGRALYQQRCAECHGDRARGRGPRADDLMPAPSDLVALANSDDVTDGYLFWRIAEGGQERGTAMPAWRNVIDDTQIWELISFLYDHAKTAR